IQMTVAGCISLKGSTVCDSGFSEYYAWADPTANAFSNITTFDKYMSSWFDTGSDFASEMANAFGCSNWTGSGFQYHISAYCGVWAYLGSAKGCATSTPSPLSPICTTTINDFYLSWNKTMNNPAICSTPTTIQSTKRAEYIDLFIALDNSAATSSSNCTVAVSMDSTSYCGLSTEALGQAFCNNQYDPCCALNGLTQVKSAPNSNESTPTTPASTSAFTQTQIEIGAGVVAAFLVIVLICVCYTRQRRKNREPKESEANLTSVPSVRSANTNNNYNNYNNNNYKGNNYNNNDYEMNSTQVQTRFDYAPSLSNSQGQYPAAYPQQQYNDHGSVYSGQQNNMQQLDRAGSRGSESYYKSIVPPGNVPPLPNLQLGPQFQRQQEKKYWVILSFRALKHDEMELVVGDIVIVKESYDDGWCLGSNPMTGASGFFPLDCLSEVPIGNGPGKAKSKFNNRVSSIYGHEGLVDDGSYYVKFDYYPAMSDELPLRTGDRAVVFDEYDDGWCFGANAATREEGLFPLDILANFVSKKFAQAAYRKDRGSSLHSSNLRKGAVVIGSKPPATNKIGADTFEAIYDFNPVQPDELTLRVGDQILVKRKYDDGWAFGTNLSNGSDGLFPLDCLAMDAKTPRKQRASSIFGSQDDSNGNIYSVYADSNNGVTKKDPNSDRVVFNYVPERPDEISLTVGDEVIVSQKFDDGWGIGRNISTGREGNFPLDCLASFSDPNATTNNGSKQTKQRVSSIFEIDASKTLSSSSGTENVIYDYEPERPDELALRVGDKVIISQKFDDGWAFGVCLSTGESGNFPLDCLSSFADNTPKKARASSIYGNNGSMYGDEQAPPVQSTVKSNGQDTVLYEFVAEKPDEVSLRVGDVVVIDKSFDDGWCFGKNLTSRKEGHFPLDCLASYGNPSAPKDNKKQRTSSIYGSEYGDNDVGGAEIAKIGPDDVAVAFTPESSDELALRVGDKIVVEKAYDDGWCFGRLVGSGKTGYFPFDCLKSYTSKRTGGKKQRVSSIYGTDETPSGGEIAKIGQDEAAYTFTPEKSDELSLR
ncbi:hypothetical protein HK100_005629, partial [Physocladia obscura]